MVQLRFAPPGRCWWGWSAVGRKSVRDRLQATSSLLLASTRTGFEPGASGDKKREWIQEIP